MKKITLLILFWMFLLSPTDNFAQEYANSPKVLPQLLACDQEEELKGQVRSITEKQGNSPAKQQLATVFYSEYDEQNRMVMMENILLGVRTYFHYGQEGRLQSTARALNRSPLDSAVYVYHDDGRIRAVMIYDINRETLREVKDVRYDSTGLPVMVATRGVHSTAVEKVIRIGEHYIDLYWGRGSMLTQALRYPFDPEKRCIIDYDRRIENVQGETAMKIFEDRNKKNLLTIHRYEYDEVGNWVVRRSYRVKKGKKLRKRNLYRMRVREIEYR